MTSYDEDEALARQLQQEELGMVLHDDEDGPYGMAHGDEGVSPASAATPSSSRSAVVIHQPASDAHGQQRIVILRGGAAGLGAVRTPRDLRAELQAAGRLRHAMIAGALPQTPNQRHGVAGGADEHAPNDAQLAALSDASLDSRAKIWCDGICSIVEFTMSVTFAALAWKRDCDPHLQTWILVFAMRHLIFLPLTIKRYRQQRLGLQLSPTDTQFKGVVWLASLFLFVVIQNHLFTVQHCDAAVVKFTWFIVILNYVQMCLPCIALTLLVVCLPCIVLVVRRFQPARGATEREIQALQLRTFGEQPPTPRLTPEEQAAQENQLRDEISRNTSTHTFEESTSRKSSDGKEPEEHQRLISSSDNSELSGLAATAGTPSSNSGSSGSNSNAPEPVSCSICMENFVAGDSLRRLPCAHDFHAICVDKWLSIRKVCPLCRHAIDKAPIPRSNSNSVAIDVA